MRRIATVGLLGVLLGLGVWGCDAQVDGEYQGEPMVTLEGSVFALQSDTSGEVDVGVLWFMSTEQAECSGPVRSCNNSTAVSSAPTDEISAECLSACGPPPTCENADEAEAWVECQHACGAEAKVSFGVQLSVCANSAVGQRTPAQGDFPAHFSMDMLAPPPAEALMASDTGERAALGWFVAVDPQAGDLTLDFQNHEPPAWLAGGSETHVLIYAEGSIDTDSTWGRYLGGAYSEGYHLAQVERGNRCGLATPDPEPETSYADVADVCGNGMCEDKETCDNCSDCIECNDDGVGVDSGRTNLDGGYHCIATSRTLAPSDDDEQGIELKLAPPDRVDWPTL
jgi:hypothetical protein